MTVTGLPTKNTSSRCISNDCALRNGDWLVESEELATNAGDCVLHTLEYDVVGRIAQLATQYSLVCYTVSSNNQQQPAAATHRCALYSSSDTYIHRTNVAHIAKRNDDIC